MYLFHEKTIFMKLSTILNVFLERETASTAKSEAKYVQKITSTNQSIDRSNDQLED